MYSIVQYCTVNWFDKEYMLAVIKKKILLVTAFKLNDQKWWWPICNISILWSQISVIIIHYSFSCDIDAKSIIYIFCDQKCHWWPLCYFYILWSQMSLMTTLLFLYSVVTNVLDDHSAISIFCGLKCHWWPLCYFYILRSQMSLMTTLLFLYSVVHPSPFMGLKFRPFLGLEIVPETKQWAVDRPGNR